MAEKYADLKARLDALNEEIEGHRAMHLTGTIAEVRALVSEFGLRPEDVFPGGAVGVRRSVREPAVAKYRDPASGAAWSGRGRRPAWFDSERASEFAVDAGTASSPAVGVSDAGD